MGFQVTEVAGQVMVGREPRTGVDPQPQLVVASQLVGRLGQVRVGTRRVLVVRQAERLVQTSPEVAQPDAHVAEIDPDAADVVVAQGDEVRTVRPLGQLLRAEQSRQGLLLAVCQRLDGAEVGLGVCERLDVTGRLEDGHGLLGLADGLVRSACHEARPREHNSRATDGDPVVELHP